MIYGRSFLFACLLTFAIAIEKPARAVDGPKDAIALATTAILMWSAGYSAWNWYHQDDPKLFVNQMAQLEGRNSWSQWYMNHVEFITVESTWMSLFMLKEHCTRIY